MRRRRFLAGAALGATVLGGLAACASRRSYAIPDADAERAFPPIGKVLSVNGSNVHVTDQGPTTGTGRPPVVLLHGASINLRDWTFSHARQLSNQQRVIAMDRPGFGYSDRRDGEGSAAAQAAQLRATAAAMGATRPIVVGHSWGAAVALAWALDAPDEISGVVSVSGATMPWGFGADVLDGLGIGRLGVDYYMSSLARGAGEGSIERFVARAFQPQTPPRGYLSYVGAPLSLRAGTLQANSEDLAGLHPALSEQSGRYETLRVPVEILHGDRDWLLSVAQHVTAFAERVPDARVRIASGVGHMAHHARPDLLQEAIDRISIRGT